MINLYILYFYKLSYNDKKRLFIEQFNKSELINLHFLDISKYTTLELENLINKGTFFILDFDRVFKLKHIFYVFDRYYSNKFFLRLDHDRLHVKTCAKNNIKGLIFYIHKVLKNPSSLIDFVYRRLFKSKINFTYFTSGVLKGKGVRVPSFTFEQSKAFIKDKDMKLYHLFLDQNLPFHRDAKISFKTKIDKNLYYNYLNNFFDQLEAKTGKKVIIALHPRTEHSKYSFKGRESYINKTAELVSKADIIMGHYSTSIHYPIIFNKKLLLLSDPQMKLCERLVHIQGFSEILNIPIIDLSNFDINNIDKHININNYVKYMHEYIIDNNINKDKPIYRFIIEEIYRLSKQNDLP